MIIYHLHLHPQVIYESFHIYITLLLSLFLLLLLLGEPQHEREDHNHVLKRIAGCLRMGQFPNVDLTAFVEAMHSPDTGLTHTALTGKRKQSVPDAEKLLSSAVAKWCKENGFPEEGRVAEVIANWHKASDGRGLNEETRRKYNLAMLEFILEDWMPYFKDQEERDYSRLDPNRFAKVFSEIEM